LYQSTKTYGHEVGLSCAFRQWRAKSHCRFLHGYAIAVKITFEADKLDERNWVVDFGGLKDLKEALQDQFDHKTVIALDDPQRGWFEEARARGMIDLVYMQNVGCEAFAERIWWELDLWLKMNKLNDRCRVVSVEVKEHGANSAIYIG
jgi:6-pyruvoyltetrahydropterin/6-carboxytetrahydropterin synthase